jgi:uncharacterized coiled-coil protein SlyX
LTSVFFDLIAPHISPATIRKEGLVWLPVVQIPRRDASPERRRPLPAQPKRQPQHMRIRHLEARLARQKQKAEQLKSKLAKLKSKFQVARGWTADALEKKNLLSS